MTSRDGQRRLDHQRVRALLEVELALAQRLAGVGGIHLIAAPVAERRCRFRRLAEWPVEGRGGLGRVGHDGHVVEAVGVQRAADRADPSVHHVARADGVGTCLGMADRGLREQLE